MAKNKKKEEDRAKRTKEKKEITSEFCQLFFSFVLLAKFLLCYLIFYKRPVNSI